MALLLCSTGIVRLFMVTPPVANDLVFPKNEENIASRKALLEARLDKLI